MNFLRTFLLSVGIVTCVYSNAIPAGDTEEYVCPPPSNIAPCTCFKAPYSGKVTAQCSNFTNSQEIKAILDRNRNWKLQDIWIVDCAMPSLPATMLEEAHFKTLNVSSTSLDSLFDYTPVTTPKLNLYLNNVKILRGFRWSEIATSNLGRLKISNMTIRTFGNEFKDHVPKGVRSLQFQNIGVTKIENRAFSDLKSLNYLQLSGGSLKKLSRDWFPRPWNVLGLDFGHQKIAALPENMFSDLPRLLVFYIGGNLLTTISEKVFTMHNLQYNFNGNPLNCNCDMKWIVGKMNGIGVFGSCVEPESLKGTQLQQLKEKDFSYCF